MRRKSFFQQQRSVKVKYCSKKLIVAALASVLTVGVQTQVLAFGLGDAMGGKKDSRSVDTSSTVDKGNQLVQKYEASTNSVNVALTKMYSAIATKAETETLEKETEKIKGEKKGPEAVTAQTAGAANELTKKLATAEKLSVEQKKEYAKGLGMLTVGAVQTKDLLPEAKDWAASTKDAVASLTTNPMAAADFKSKINDGLYVASELPGHASKLTATVSAAIEFAKKNDIDVSGAKNMDL